jgi:hypothetical protein
MPLKVHPLRIMVIAWSNVTDTKENQSNLKKPGVFSRKYLEALFSQR